MNQYLQATLAFILTSILYFSNQLFKLTLGPTSSPPSSPFVYKSYQTSIYCSPPAEIQTPSTIQEIVEIVRNAIENGQTVKAIGSRHSLTDVICTDGIPIDMHGINSTQDNGDGTATFGAGLELIDALKFLEQRNLTLIHVPAYGGITLGGAIGTGAHGSSLLHTPSISDQVVSLKIIDGLGNIQLINETEALKPFRVHLGLLGILVEVTLKTVPLFKMRVQNVVESESILFDGTAVSWAKQFDWFQFWWFPTFEEVVVSKGNYTDISAVGNASTNLIPNQDPLLAATWNRALEVLQGTRNLPAEIAMEKFTQLSLYTNVVGKPPIFTEDGLTVSNPAVGYAWRLQASYCTPCAWEQNLLNRSILPEETSMAFDIASFPEVFTMMKDVLSKYPASFYMIGAFVRFSKASDALMAISSGRDSFTVEFVTPMRRDPFNTPKHGIGAYQAMLQAMVAMGGRPHWGKNGGYYFTQKVLNSAVPNRAEFVQAMATYDPNRLFFNKFGNRILGLSDLLDKDPSATKCALQDYCVCQSSSDCADLMQCARLNGFPICKNLIPSNPPVLNFGNLQNFTEILSVIARFNII